MKFLTKCECAGKSVVLDDMILTKDMPTTAGSKMLDGYMSLFDAEVVSQLRAAGFDICGKANVGEFAIDTIGETSYFGALTECGEVKSAAAEIVKSGEAVSSVCLEANGNVMRAAAVSGLVSIKPTYGIVSRFGVVPVACSGDTVSFMAKSAKICREMLAATAHHDTKDGTSHAEDVCAGAVKCDKEIRRVALPTYILDTLEASVTEKIDAMVSTLCGMGIEVVKIDAPALKFAHAAWNILMSAELCNNVSKYDGVKYGYRTENFTNIDELYTGSRTEAFGELLKYAIIFGSDALSTDNYLAKYDKALRVRRLVVEEFARIFGEFDAVLTPLTSTMSYTEDFVNEKGVSFKENCYTAPIMISGLPAVVTGGVGFVAPAFSDGALLTLAEKIEEV